MQIIKEEAIKLIRGLLIWLCQVIYPVIANIFELFMKIATLELMKPEKIKAIYTRITLVLSLVMLFYITFELIKYLIQPETITDKQKGLLPIPVKIVVIIALIAFMPTIFTGAGLLQASIVKNEVIQKIILGKQSEKDSQTNQMNYENLGKSFSWGILNTFYYLENSDPNATCDGIPCSAVIDLNKTDLLINGSLSYMTIGVNSVGTSTIISSDGNNQEVETANIHFDGLWAIIFGSFVLYVLLLYCIDLGTRAVQLLYLEIISPIPVIGILSPNKDKNIFKTWLQQCITTYLDVFIRLIIINFIILICTVILDGEIFEGLDSIENSVKIALVMGMLLFAHRAPKLIQELLPKMGVASGNFGIGLKSAGERIAPEAARAIGGALGGSSRLLLGGISQGVNRYRRNKRIQAETGKTAGQRRSDLNASKYDLREKAKEMRAARKAMHQAHTKDDKLRARNRYDQAQIGYMIAKSNVVDNKTLQNGSVLGNALGGAVGGAVRGASTGFGATKAEEILKKGWKEAGNTDKKAINAKEKWLDEGGYSNADRIMTGLAQSIGISTPAENTEKIIKNLDNKIKRNQALNQRETAVGKSLDVAKDRSNSKISSGEQYIAVSENTFNAFEPKDSSGKKTNLLDFLKDNEIAEDSFSISKHQDSAGNWHYEYTTSSIHKGFDAEIKKADNTAASKTASLEQLKTKKTEIDNTLQSLDARKDEKTAAIEGKKEKIEEKINERNSHEEGSSAYIRISNEIANLEAEKGQLKMEEAAIEQEITTAEDNKRMTDQQIDATQTEIDEASQRSTALKDMQGKMLKELTAYAITTVLNSPDDASIDGLLKNQVQTALATMKESTREEDTVNAMREELLKVNPNDTKLFEKYMTGEIKTFKEFDDIQTALNNIAAKRNDENIELQGSKGRLESSSLFAAQQADKNSSNSGK